MHIYGLLSRSFPTRYVASVVVLAAGSCASYLAFQSATNSERAALETRFQRASDGYVAAFEKQLDANLSVLRAVAAYYVASEVITRSEFARFVDPLLRHSPGIHAVVWVPRVPSNRRLHMETAARLEGITDYAIRDLRPNGEFSVADARPEYFPVSYVHSVEPLSIAELQLGTDLLRLPNHTEWISVARGRRLMTATSSVLIDASGEVSKALLVYQPIYHEAGDGHEFLGVPDRLLGFAVGVFRMSQLMDQVVSLLGDIGMGIQLRDPANPDDPPLYQRLPSHLDASTPSRAEIQPPSANERAVYSRVIPVAGQSWTAGFSPSREMQDTVTWRGWGVLGTGLALSVLVAGYLQINIGRRARVEALVAQRTTQLSRANEHMETEIARRQRVQEELFAAKERAEAADAAKSSFLANMSHEIRTPMNGVLGMTGLLLDTHLTTEQDEYARAINNSADSLLTIINDILDFSKLEAGKMTIEPIPFDLYVSVEDVAEMFAPKAEEQGLELMVSFGPGVPRYIVADAGRVRQILTNLVGNAIKFTHAGHVLIEVEGLELDEADIRLRFSVNDTGIGIDEAHVARLFEKFTQADVTTTRQYGGTGLGLAIVNQLATLMHGEVGASSAVGVGSTFWFTMRCVLSDQRPPPPIAHCDLTGIKVLSVDDNATNRRILHECLAKWGMSASEVGSGAQALKELRDAAVHGEPYRIAMLDHDMPGMDGEELARYIKNDVNLREMIVVMLTSRGRRGDAMRLQQIGFAAYLTKPIRASQLRHALSAVLSGSALDVNAPLVTSHSLAEALAVDPPPAQTQATSDVSLHGARVLIVEDNIVNQKVAERLLAKIGCRTDLAANGREAVEMVGRFPYDIVLMDCQMPELDGYTATKIVRESEYQSDVPIIAMTANAMQGDKERCLDSGMDDYISKPVNAEVLREKLGFWITKRSSMIAG